MPAEPVVGEAQPSAGSPETPREPARASVEVVATGLDVPWGLAPLPDGRLLVTLRDEARLVVVDPGDGTITDVGGPGGAELAETTEPRGEGGLLGVAVPGPGGGAKTPSDAVTVFLYRTGEEDNAVVSAPLTLGPEPALGDLTIVVDGIGKAGNHNGGQIAFGPDGSLYVATGDAGEPSSAQDPESLNGKILRVTARGDPAPGNPGPRSPVWSLGHRNVQGIGWDADGRMFASEFGQATWDELNQILPGRNYGWPEVEGMPDGAGDGPAPHDGPAVVDGLTVPLAVWPTSDASPSGLAVTEDAVYLAALRGERLWRVPLGAAAQDDAGAVVLRPEPLLADHGRLRAVVADADGTLWVLTSNTDGRGSVREGDDRLLRVVIAS